MTRPATTRSATTPKHATVLLFLAVLAAACASGPSGPPPFDPVGSYQYSASVEGMTVAGVMTIQGTEGAYSGELRSDMFPTVPIQSVVVEGQAVTIQAAGPQGPLTLQLGVADGALSGTWTMAGGSGSFTGTKTN